MTLTDENREARLKATTTNNEVLLRDVYEKLDVLVVGPSREVTTAVLAFVVAMYSQIGTNTDAENKAMLARLHGSISPT